MPRIRICTVCGAEFTSRNGKEVCSESCGLERKRNKIGKETNAGTQKSQTLHSIACVRYVAGNLNQYGVYIIRKNAQK